MKEDDQMIMNKLIPLVCAVMLALCVALPVTPACAETVIGMIADKTEDGFSLHTAEETLHAVITEETIWDISGEPENGDVATILFCRPANQSKLYAKVITCHKLHGTVSRVVDAEEPYLLLLPDNGTDEIRVNLSNLPHPWTVAGIAIQVYYNGKQTRSVPPQITALYLRGITLRGTITEIGESGVICLQKEDGEKVLLHPTDETMILTEPEAGKSVEVSVLPAMRLSLPAQYEIQDILPVNK